jgi:hypothetical protein
MESKLTRCPHAAAATCSKTRTPAGDGDALKDSKKAAGNRPGGLGSIVSTAEGLGWVLAARRERFA